MFRTALLAFLALSAVAVAMPSPGGNAGQCNGTPLCCTGAAYRADSPEGRAALSAFNINADDVEGHKIIATSCGDNGLIGVGGGSSCSQAPVCCESNSIGSGSGLLGLGIGVGCTTIPISI